MIGDEMSGNLVDERDLKFVLFDLLGVQDLAQTERFEHIDQETLEMLLNEALKFSEQRLYPLNLEGDKIGVKYEGGSACCSGYARGVSGVCAEWLAHPIR